jgi:hypothetical protein
MGFEMIVTGRREERGRKGKEIKTILHLQKVILYNFYDALLIAI